MAIHEVHTHSQGEVIQVSTRNHLYKLMPQPHVAHVTTSVFETKIHMNCRVKAKQSVEDKEESQNVVELYYKIFLAA